MTTTNELIERITEATGRHFIDPGQSDRAQDADTCACGQLVDAWDEHWAEAALAAIQGLYVPPPPGSDRDALPDWIVPLISAFVRPYTSTGCEAAQAIRRVISGRYSNQTAELAEWEQREHASCRLTRKQDLAKCICPCHQEPTP